MSLGVGTYGSADITDSNIAQTYVSASDAVTWEDETSPSLISRIDVDVSTPVTDEPLLPDDDASSAPAEYTSEYPATVSSPITSSASLPATISVDLSSTATVEESEVLYTTTIWIDEHPGDIDPGQLESAANNANKDGEDIEIVSCDTAERTTWITGGETETATKGKEGGGKGGAGATFSGGGRRNYSGSVSTDYLGVASLRFVSFAFLSFPSVQSLSIQYFCTLVERKRKGEGRTFDLC